MIETLSKELENYKKSFSILIADDNEDNCYTLVQRLKREGYSNITVVHDGVEALDILNKQHFDLLLLDIMMPKMDGFAVLRQLKSDNSQPSLVILVISSTTEINNIVECIKLGAADFLPKPFDVDILRVRVNACLEKAWFIEQDAKNRQQLDKERKTYKDLLSSILPLQIVEELTKNNTVKPQVYANVGIIFVDLAGFTLFCRQHTPDEIFENLQLYIDLCEKLARVYKLEKIKTVGDSFMAATNMLEKHNSPIASCIDFSLALFKAAKELPTPWKIHAGIDYGPVVGGILGEDKYLFEVWGDAVNTASRLQEMATPDTIYLSKEARNNLQNFTGTSLGMVEVKGKGLIEVFEIQGGK